MKQSFIRLIKKKLNRGILLLLSVAMVLTMLPLFTFNASAATYAGTGAFFTNQPSHSAYLEYNSSNGEWKSTGSASNYVQMSLNLNDKIWTNDQLAVLQSGGVTATFSIDAWTPAWGVWSWYTAFVEVDTTTGKQYFFPTDNPEAIVFMNSYYENVPFFENKNTWVRRTIIVDTLPSNTNPSSVYGWVMQPANDAVNWGNRDYGWHDKIAYKAPSLRFEFQTSFQYSTFVKTTPTASQIISGQTLASSTFSGGTVVTSAAFANVANPSAISGSWSWNNPSQQVTSTLTTQSIFTPVYNSSFSNVSRNVSVPVRAAVISLNANGGSGGSNSADGWFGSNPANITMPTKTGYIFKGYYSAISGGTQYYNNSGVSVKNWDIAADTTLYAQWEEQCTVSNISAPAAITTGSKLTIATPTVTGTPTLQGWQYSANGSAGWTYFAPSTKTFTVNENGYYIRYYATKDANTAASNIVQITVNKYTPALTITATPTSSVFPQNVILSATLTGVDSISGKAVKFYDGANYLGTSDTDINGKATYSVTSPTVSAHSYKAVFEGDTNNITASSSTLNYNVSKGTQSAVSFANINDITKTYGETSFTLSTVSGGSGTGAYSYRSSNTEIANVAGNTVTIKATGEAIIYVKKLGDTNYNDSTESSVKVKVSPKSVTISGMGANNKTYDGNLTASINTTNAIVNGIINDDTVSIDYTNASATFADKNSSNNKTVTFTGFALSGFKSGNYTLSTQPASVSANITPKPITVSGITAQDKTYDGNNSATLLYTSVALTGKLDGDALWVTATGTYANSNAQDVVKTVNISALTLSGASANNYVLSPTGQQASTTAKITPRAITVKPDSVKYKYYGQSDPTLTYTYTSPVSEETANFSGALSRTAGETAGNYPINLGTLALVNNGAFLASNYQLYFDTNTVLFEIKAYTTSAVATTAPNGPNGWYQSGPVTLTAPPGYQISSSDALSGNTWANQITLNDADGANKSTSYYLKAITGAYINAISTVKTFSYKLDKTAPTGTLTIKSNGFTSFLNTITFGLFFKENVNVRFDADSDVSGISKTEFIKSTTAISEDDIKTSTAWANFSNTSINAADKEKFIYYIRLTDNAGNVSYISSNGITFDTKNPTIITNYLKGDSSITFTVADETAGIANVNCKVGTAEEKTVTVNENGQFTVSNLEDGNYNVVVKAIDNAGNEYSLTQAITSRHDVKYMDNTSQIGETSIVDYGVNLTKPADPIKAGYIFDGWYKDSEFNTLWNFASDPITTNTMIYAKYTPKQSVAASITQADVVYGTVVNPNATCSSTGTKTIEYKVKGANDNTYTTTKPTNAGEYTARVSVTESSLYLSTSAACDFEITVKELTITNLSINNKVYDGTTTATFYGIPTLSGLVYSDQIALTNGTPSFGDKNVGQAKTISFTNFGIAGDAASNYALTQPTGITANITAKTITVSQDALSKNVGQTDPTLTYTYTSPVSEETANFSGALSRTAGETAGNYPINLGTLALVNNGAFLKSNYSLELSNSIVNFTINNVTATSSDYQVKGNEGAWNTADMTITPSGDYTLISTDGTNWSNSITLNTEGNPSTADFYLKKADGTTTDKDTYSYKLDKTAPTAIISQGDNNWSKFLNTITFGLFFKDTQTVTISSADTNGSGIASTGYYVLEVDNNTGIFEVTLGQAQGYTYTMGTSCNFGPDKNVIVFAKIVDNAGNITYVNSQGIVLDETAPVIGGITDGATYYTTREVTITDPNLDTITVNNEAFTGNTIAGDADQTYTVVATDKSGNITTYTVTMKTIASLSTTIESLTTNNVKSSDKAAIEAIKTALSAVDITNATQAEKDKLKGISDKCDTLLAKITDIEDKIADVNTKTNGITTDNVKSSDKTNLESSLSGIKDLLATNNLTDDEKSALEQKKTDVEDALTKIDEVETAVTEAQNKVKDITKDNVTNSDKTMLEQAEDDLQNILDNDVNNLTEAEIQVIEDQIYSIEIIINTLEEVAEVEDLIGTLPNGSEVTKADADAIAKANDAYETLTDHQKEIVDSTLKTKLDEAIDALNKVLLFDAPTGTRVEGVNGTVFDLRIELVVTPVKDTLDKNTMNKYAIGVTNAANHQEIAQLYDVKLLLDGQPIQPEGKVKITFKLTDEQQNYKDLQVVFIADDGTVTIIPSEINGDEVSFITDHFSYYGIIGTPIKKTNPNTDPNTGDNMPVIPLIALTLLSAILLVVIRKNRIVNVNI